MPPAVPMWLRMVKDVRQARFRRAMQMPWTTATRRRFSGTDCQRMPAAVSMRSRDVQDSRRAQEAKRITN